MATQQGPILINGTLGGITFYKREGKWLARKKTSLDKERVSTDPAFKNSMAATKNFLRAAKLAKEIYGQLPEDKRGQGVIGKLTGIANSLLAKGNKIKEVKQKLQEQFIGIR